MPRVCNWFQCSMTWFVWTHLHAYICMCAWYISMHCNGHFKPSVAQCDYFEFSKWNMYVFINAKEWKRKKKLWDWQLMLGVWLQKKIKIIVLLSFFGNLNVEYCIWSYWKWSSMWKMLFLNDLTKRLSFLIGKNLNGRQWQAVTTKCIKRGLGKCIQIFGIWQ